MSVETFTPQISVVLKKNIGRATVGGSIAASQRFQGTRRTIDLTPWLGEVSQVVVQKSVREPAGMFSITLVDKMDIVEQDSLYGLIEPLDIIEIRMARDISVYATGSYTNNMPIMMRGLVTRVGRPEIMTEQGPRRAVTVRGQDYGKILQMSKIAYLPNMVTGQNLLSQFKLFMNYGVDSPAEQDVNDFVSGIINGPIAKFISQMQSAANQSGQGGTSPVVNIKVEASAPSAQVSPFGVNAWPGGTFYDLLAYFGDVGNWNELYIEDREDAPYLVFRPLPYKDISGNFIQTIKFAPTVVAIGDKQVVSINPERSDEPVFNYFWADCPNYSLVEGALLQAYAARTSDDTVYVSDYPNCEPTLYGFRPLEVQTQQGPRIDGQPSSKYETGKSNAVEFMQKKRQILIDNNRDNIVFESGSIDLRGDEAVKAGSYLQVTRNVSSASSGGGFVAEYYAHSVTHTFEPFRGFRTVAEFDRGTGFIKRIQRDGGSDSPYLSELNAGGVYAS